MTRIRKQLRRAAQDFAEQVYDLLRGDILAELRRELAADARQKPSARTPRRRTTPQRPVGATPLERVLVYVTEHPGTKPKTIIDDTGMGRPAVFAALAAACSMGALVKEGQWRHVSYSPAGHARAAEPAPAPPKPKYRRSEIGATDIIDDVVAFIAAHAGCRRSELTTAFPVTSGVLRHAFDLAREGRRIRMEGTRAVARYFPLETPPSSPATKAATADDRVMTSTTLLAQ